MHCPGRRARAIPESPSGHGYWHQQSLSGDDPTALRGPGTRVDSLRTSRDSMATAFMACRRTCPHFPPEALTPTRLERRIEVTAAAARSHRTSLPPHPRHAFSREKPGGRRPHSTGSFLLKIRQHPQKRGVAVCPTSRHVRSSYGASGVPSSRRRKAPRTRLLPSSSAPHLLSRDARPIVRLPSCDPIRLQRATLC